MIRNSDDESDSDASLHDMDNLLTARKLAVTSNIQKEQRQSGSSPTAQIDRQVEPTLDLRRLRGGATTTYRAKSEEPQKYKFSLKTLQAQSRDDQAIEEDVAKAHLLLDSLEQEQAMGEITSCHWPRTEISASADLAASILKDKGVEEDYDKLVTAVQRTETFHQEKKWAFFADEDVSIPLDEISFPKLQNGQFYCHLNRSLLQNIKYRADTQQIQCIDTKLFLGG